jgi:hypothetical protein
MNSSDNSSNNHNSTSNHLLRYKVVHHRLLTFDQIILVVAAAVEVANGRDEVPLVRRRVGVDHQCTLFRRQIWTMCLRQCMEGHLRRILLVVALEVVDVVALRQTIATGVLHEDAIDDSGRVTQGAG